MKISRFLNLLLIPLLISACESGNTTIGNRFSDIDQYFDLAWANSPYWDDGKAEVAIYQGNRNIYGKDRSFETTHVTVAEQFNKQFNVKTDDYSRNDLFRIVKYHAFARIPTDNYPYHFSTSIFIRRDNPLLLHKMTSSSQEWCGNTFKEFNNDGRTINFQFSSYWDNEGSGANKLENAGFFEDQLGYTLRSLHFKDGLQFKSKVLNTQVSNKVGTPVFYDAEFNVSESDTTFLVRVALAAGKKNSYEFRKVYPNVMIRQSTWDKRNLRLLKVSRYAYWQN